MAELLHEFQIATFGAAMKMHYDDLHGLRTLMRKAHCFTLDTQTSAMLPQVSYSIAHDLELMQKVAIPPYPLTWVEIDNEARLTNQEFNANSLGKDPTDIIPRVGWLIEQHPTQKTAYRMSYVGSLERHNMRPWMIPIAMWWDVESLGCPWEVAQWAVMKNDDGGNMFSCLGIASVDLLGTGYCIAPGGPYTRNLSTAQLESIISLIIDINGELRYVWAFLMMLTASSGFKASMKPLKREPVEPFIQPNGKELFRLEHKHLVINLSHKRDDVKQATWRALSGARKRLHDVRGHMRTLRNADGSIRKVVSVRPHQRGDRHLGVITKTYEVRR